MNFLALCKRLRQEAGYSGNGPATVDGQAGEMKRVVDWVASAWIDIQSLRDWFFMLHPFSLTLLQGETSVAVGFNASRLLDDSIYVTTSDGAKVTPVQTQAMDYRRVARSTMNIPSFPKIVTLQDESIHVFPTAHEDMMVEGEAYRRPTNLVANTDEPDMPDEFHMLIVWRALMDLAAYDEAGNLWNKAVAKYTEIESRLVANESPRIRSAEPLA